MSRPEPHFSTPLGAAWLGDCLDTLRREVVPQSAALIVTSPPFALTRAKEYGNAAQEDYLDWFRPFACRFRSRLRPDGSLVLDVGGAWEPGRPTRSLYQYKLLIMLCEEFGFHLAQEFFWWNPSKLPSPAEWVTVRRIRVKDAVNCVWWLSPTPWPRASNRRVLIPYSDSMRRLVDRGGGGAGNRPSGHAVGDFAADNGASIPPNLIAFPNTESNSAYIRYCKDRGIKPHPARFPASLPEYFVRMLTDPGDLVVDPFAGSCTTGEVCERLGRRWLCAEMSAQYLDGARGRFPPAPAPNPKASYPVASPTALWDAAPDDSLDPAGGFRDPAARVAPEDSESYCGVPRVS